MSTCKTGCGTEVHAGARLCDTCHGLWMESPESDRCAEFRYNDVRGNVAFTDFCNRVRAERSNGAPHAN